MKKFILVQLVLMIFFFSKSQSQIIYTDVNPDSSVSASESEQIKSYFIDLDNNGIYEYELRHFNPDPENMDVEIQRNHVGSQEVIILSNGHSKVLFKNDTVSPNSVQWGNDGYGILNTPWYGGSDKFFGFRFKISGAWHYGWARVQIAADHSSFTIKDFAYNSIPNETILAGQMSTTGMSEFRSKSSEIVTIYPNPVVTKATFQINYHQGNCVMFVYNLLGEKVRVLKQVQTGKFTFNRENLRSGLYFFEIRNGSEILHTGKFYISD